MNIFTVRKHLPLFFNVAILSPTVMHLEVQTTSFLWLFQLDDSKSLHKKWLFHQTSIKKWLFRVPGRSTIQSHGSGSWDCHVRCLQTATSPGDSFMGEWFMSGRDSCIRDVHVHGVHICTTCILYMYILYRQMYMLSFKYIHEMRVSNRARIFQKFSRSTELFTFHIEPSHCFLFWIFDTLSPTIMVQYKMGSKTSHK